MSLIEVNLDDMIVAAIADAVAERIAGTVAPAPAVNGGGLGPWLDAEAAARYIGAKSKQRIYDLVSQRKVRFAKEGSRTLFLPEWLDELVAVDQRPKR